MAAAAQTQSVDAAVLAAPGGAFTVEPLQLTGLGEHDILVKIAGTGLCHTDLGVREVPFFVPGPRILGHEGAGVIESVGAGVTGLTVGDHVVLSYNSCGGCAACRGGSPYHCERFGPANDAVDSAGSRLARTDGTPVHHHFFGQSSFASHAVTNSRNTVRVDADLPLDTMGALGCGLLTGAGAMLNALAVRPGMSVGVFGVGAVGLSAVMTAKLCGASRIVAVDVHESRLDLARELGATETFNGKDPELAARIGADVGALDRTLDTTGVTPVMATAVDVLRPGGSCGLVGVGGPIELNPFSLVLGRTVTGIVEGNAVPQILIPQLIRWWRAGDYPFERLLTRFPLTQINEAVAAATSGSVIKAVLIPGHPSQGAT